MRISDWSSDMCSSELPQFHRRAALGNHLHVEVQRNRRDHAGGADVVDEFAAAHFAHLQLLALAEQVGGHGGDARGQGGFAGVAVAAYADQQHHGRSEEHTSELQSLMRISYAVFCLKKKNNTQIK